MYSHFEFHVPAEAGQAGQPVLGATGCQWMDCLANEFGAQILQYRFEAHPLVGGAILMANEQGQPKAMIVTVMLVAIPVNRKQAFFDHVRRRSEEARGLAPVSQVADSLMASVDDDSPPEGAVIPPE